MFGPSVSNGFRVPPKSTIAIRAQALKARRVLGVADRPFFPMAIFIERLFDLGITVDIVEDDELPLGVEACCAPESAVIMLSHETYRRAAADDGRGRFTVIHELGHLTLSHTRTFHRESQRRIQVFEDSEWQANTFAAEFLMPLDDIQKKGLRNPEQIMMEYQVSAQAAEVRIRKLQKEKLI